MSPLLAVTGTGTGIGKTFFARELVRAWAAAQPSKKIAGIKPIESGVPRNSLGADVLELGQVSTFHVTRFTPPYLLMDAVSPHLAARREGKSIDSDVIVEWVRSIRDEADGVVVELAGGLFSPLGESELTNASLLAQLHVTKTILVAPDRLGVLHDVIAATTAARGKGIQPNVIVLVETRARSADDASIGTNAVELTRTLRDCPPIFQLPWCETPAERASLAVALTTFANEHLFGSP